MHARRRLLLMALLAPATLACGCRSTPIEFDLWGGFVDSVVDTAFDAIDGDETPAEEAEEDWQEFRSR
jgi:hypothetical protein